MTREDYIKQLISEKGFSVKTFSENIKIPYSTLRSMLNGSIGGAAVDSVIKICAGLGITINDLQSCNTNKLLLTTSEKDSQKTSNLHKLINNYNSLNTHGKSKLVEYSDDLINSQKYSDTVTIAEVARTNNNRKSLNKRQVKAKELEIFDNTPQSDEEL